MQPALLVLNTSARVTRSLTHQLTGRFARAWLARHPGAALVRRDFALSPPPAIDEAWIAAAFTPAGERTPAQRAVLALSETLIAEIEAATAIVVGAPLYNFGMPASLKAWFDQVVRVDRTFVITDDPAEPYRPLLAPKPVVVLTSAGSAAFQPGGEAAHLNFLEPHVRTLFEFIGLPEVTFVRVGDAGLETETYADTLRAAESALDVLAAA